MSRPPDFDYRARLKRARQAVEARQIDVLLLSVGADLPYLIGYEAMPLERLTMLALPAEGEAVLVVPRLEAPRVEERPELFELRSWEETEDPVEVVVEVMGKPDRAAIGDRTWSVFLLGLQERLPAAEFVSADPLMTELRIRKDPLEVECLRRAAQAVDRVVDRLRDHRFEGKTERRLATEIAEMTVEEGHQTANFTIVAAGPNGASPHHEPGDRVIEQGDAVVVDFGGRWHGYFSDISRDFVVGDPDPDYLEDYAVLAEAQEAGRAAVRPGVPAEDVDRAARAVIESAGRGELFIHRTGHGIGLEGHEAPYLVEGNPLALEPGMAFSVEPGIYRPGRYGLRIEDIVVVTDDGAESLNQAGRDPIAVG